MVWRYIRTNLDIIFDKAKGREQGARGEKGRRAEGRKGLKRLKRLKGLKILFLKYFQSESHLGVFKTLWLIIYY